MKMRLQQAFFNSSQGPQHREFRKEILQAMQVGGAPTQRISKRNSTGNASWRGPNTEKLDSQFLQTMQVGGAPTQKLTKSQLTI
ncbi:TPA: hypothetical protein OZM60_001307, partial [Staphylococcus aureus]|nr:hypothetical protein [Staphylococcus aureus]